MLCQRQLGLVKHDTQWYGRTVLRVPKRLNDRILVLIKDDEILLFATISSNDNCLPAIAFNQTSIVTIDVPGLIKVFSEA